MKDFVLFARHYDTDKIIFRKFSNWGFLSAKQYSAMNLFSRSHPRHQEFLEVLEDPFLKDPQIELPPLDLEAYQASQASLPGLGFHLISQTSREKFIGPDSKFQLYTFNETSVEMDYYDVSKGAFSRRAVATENGFMGFGFYHDDSLNISEYKTIHLTIKSPRAKEENLYLLITDANGEYKVKLCDFGFKADHLFHDIRVPLSEFTKLGLDLTRVKYSFGILMDGVVKGDYFFLNDLYME